MTDYMKVRESVLRLVGDIHGWDVYADGIAPAGKTPPWVVIGLTETSRTHTESQSTDLHIGRLDIRIVARSQTSVDTLASHLTERLDGARPDMPGLSPLIGDVDTGSTPSDLTDPDTGTPYMMRVLTWRIGWPETT